MPDHTITLGEYTLTLDTGTGRVNGLRRGPSPDALPAAGSHSVAEAELAYRPVEGEARYLRHEVEGDQLFVEVQHGPVIVADAWRAVNTAAGPLLERRITVRNASDAEQQLTGARLALSGVAVGDPAACTFEAPANVVRPRQPLAAAARQPVGASLAEPPNYDDAFAPGQHHRWGRALGEAPDVGPGLMVVASEAANWNLLTWYVSDVEAARPWVGGSGETGLPALGFDMWLAGWLAPGASLTGGVQVILLHEGSYDDALAAYRRSFTHTGILPAIYQPLDRAADWTGVYEVHPGQYGGFEGLRGALKSIRQLGVDTLYLMPVHAHRNKPGWAWEENWYGVGSPYAIHDFRQLEPSLGSEEDFQRLVESAHEMGMRVLIDLVLQGSSLEARYVQEHPEWYARDEAGEMLHSHGWNDTWSFDWGNPDYQRFVLDYTTYYVERFDIDGFRVDAPHGKEPNWARNLPYHAGKTNLGTSELLEELRRRLKTIKPDAALYCELFGPLWVRSHDISNDYHPYAMVLQLFEGRLIPYEFNEYLRDYWAVQPRAEDGTPTPRICFTETHDTRSWPAYAIRGSDVEQALLGVLVMAGFVPMIWAGQEERQREFLRGLLLARRHSAALRRGQWVLNRTPVSDLGHYRRRGGEDTSGHALTIIRHTDDEVLLGIASFLPEKATFEFSLPVDDLPLDPAGRYALRDLITYTHWSEYGRADWSGEELRALRLTPDMYRPYIFRIERVG